MALSQRYLEGKESLNEYEQFMHDLTSMVGRAINLFDCDNPYTRGGVRCVMGAIDMYQHPDVFKWEKVGD